MKNLTICPSINRPEQIKTFVESFYRTQKVSDLIILTAPGSITKLINSVNRTGYTHVTITNDDFVFHTDAWDKRLIDAMRRPGFAHGFDGVNKSIPTTCMIDNRICDALGWVQLPDLEHLCGDMVWHYLGQLLNSFFTVPDVLIEHNHFMYQKAQKDSVYEKTNSREMYLRDNQVFETWRKNQADSDVERIRMALSNVWTDCGV